MSTTSRSQLSLSFPVAMQRSDHGGISWYSLRAQEEFDIDDRDYKILHGSSSAVAEWTGVFSKILLLPNMEGWHVFVTFSVILNFVLSLYCAFFVPERILFYIPVYGACDGVYLFDLILNLLLKYWKKMRMKSEVKPKPIYLLVADFLSLLPQEGVVGSIFGFHHRYILRCRFFTYIRLYRVMHLFGDILGSVRNRRWTWFLGQYVVLFSIILHTAVCVWFSLGCITVCREKFYWTAVIFAGTIVMDTISQWYMTCQYIAITLMSNTGFGDFYATRIVEGLYCIVVMLGGFMMITILIAVLTVQLVNVGYRRSKFSYELKNVKDVLGQINAPAKLSKRVLSYYEVLWTNKNGVNEAPELYNLPTPLKMELMYDINIAHLQNSLLLQNQPEALLRKISLLFKHVFLLPEDVVYHQGVVKDMVVFVSSGILEILSDEDDQSPIISFRAGTVLGELALLTTLPAKATVRAATYVELQVIKRQDFMRMMLDHPDATAKLRAIAAERLERASEQSFAYDKSHIIMNLLVSNAREFRPIKLLKDHLLKAKRESAALPGFPVDDSSSGTTDQKFLFSKACLGLYKLAPNVTMMESPKVCTTSKFPWIFDPKSSLVFHWNNLVNISQSVLCLIFPYYIVYVRELSDSVTLYGYLADAIYLLDIYMRCTTEVVLRNRTIKKFWLILNYRMGFLSFYVDVLSLFPIEVFVFALSVSKDEQNRLFVLLKLNRMLRAWRVSKIFSNLEKDLSRNVLVLTVIKYMLYLILCAFWAGAFLYLEACMYPICTEDSWFYIRMVDAMTQGKLVPCYQYPLAISTYFGTMALYLVGYGDVLPNSHLDILCVSFLILIGILLVCYCTAQLCATFSLGDYFRKDFQENVVAFGRFLEQNNLVHSLNKRVITFFRLQWSYDKGTGRDFLLSTAPPHLRSTLQSTELKDALSQTVLFQMIDIDFLLMIAEGARVQVLPRNEVIAYTGDMSREMYIVLNGHCQVLDDSGLVHSTYGPGAQFGAVEMIYGIPKRYTTRTVTNCKVISVDYRTYVQAMSMFPAIYQETKKVMEAEDLTEWVRTVDAERLRAKIVKPPSVKRNITQKLCLLLNNICRCFTSSFVFTRCKCRKSKGKEKYWKPFKTLGKFQFLGYLLMPLTIHPQGPFIRLWCAIRVVSIMTVCFVRPYYVAVVPSTSYLFWVMIATDVCAYLDIYLLLHMGFYDQKGVLITHPKHTAKNYLTHGFILDVLAVFPFHALIMWDNPQHNEGHDRVTHLISPHIRHCMWYLNGILQFHRVHELFHYMEGDIMKGLDAIRFFKFLPTTLVLINLLTSLVFGINCVYKFQTTPDTTNASSQMIVRDPHTNTVYYGYLRCEAGCWLDESQFQTWREPFEIYTVAFYWMTSTLLGVGMGDVSAHLEVNMYLVVGTILIGRLLFAYIFANLAMGRAQFSTVMSKYQENLHDLMVFLKREAVDLYWRKQMFKHFEYVWKRTWGVRSQELCQKLNTALMEDTVVFLYEKTLRDVPLFENVDKSFIRVIAKHLTEEYFLKGDMVIKSWDIQNNIYIIYRGKVEVLSCYDEMIGCMGPGGLFGNIRQVNAGCSSISIVASRNLDVLVISSETFYNVIKDYPRTKRNMDTLLETVTDYIMPTTIIDEGSEDASADMLSAGSAHTEIDREMGSVTGETESQATPHRSFGSFSVSHMQAEDKSKFASLRFALFLCMPNKWFKFAFYPQQAVLKFFSTIVLLVAYYDVLVISYVFVTQADRMDLTYFNLIVETIFYFKIFLSFHTAYIDRYGNYITRFKLIARNYFANRWRVFWDVVPNLPVELLVFLFPLRDRMFVLSILRLLHLLRIQYMLDYFSQVNKRLMANLAFNQILKLALFLSITVHIFACAWLMTACPMNVCRNGSWVDVFNFTDNKALQRYSVSVYYVISLTTTTGLGDIYPNTMIEVAFSILLMLISRFLTALIIGHQMEKLWWYLRSLWAQEKGQHIPKMIKDCPYVLRCEIMNVLFGQHLYNSYVFQGVNQALMRQLAVRLNRIVFFKGNYIVQHGDINQNMYFIYSGEVSVLTVHPNLTETQHELLKTHDMFGLAQGLYHGLPHHFSFRANTKVIILVLNLDSWYYMLKYFPEDKELIYNRAQTVYVKV